MGLLDDAFKKAPARKQFTALGIFGQKPTGKKVTGLRRSRKPVHRKISTDVNLPSINRRKPTTLVPYGSGRQGIFETPMVTPPPKMSTSMTVRSPTQVAVWRPPKRNGGGSLSSSGFNFNNPFGSTASQQSGFGSNIGSSQPLGSSSGISAGKRHKGGKVVGGIGAKIHGRGERDTGIELSTVQRNLGILGKSAEKVGEGVGRSILKIGGFGDTKAQKQKTRKSIGKQLRKGIGSMLFKGKKRLI